MKKPNKEGWWNYDNCCIPSCRIHKDIEVYKGPNGELCVWCEDLDGQGVDSQDFSDGDEMCGHIMVLLLGGKWLYLRPLDDTQKT